MKQIVVALLGGVLFVQIIQLESPYTFPETAIGAISPITEVAMDVPNISQFVSKRIANRAATEKYDSVLFVGDVMLARNVEVLSKRYGYEYPYAGLSLRALGNNPAVFANFESASAPTHSLTPAYTMRFSTNPVLLPALAASGYTHVSLANNHTFDYGIAGYEQAISGLEAVGIETLGCPNTVSCVRASHLYVDGVRVSVIAVEDVATKLQLSETTSLLHEVSKSSDIQVVYIHWGNEYELTNSRQQRQLAEEMVAAGADLIVGHHPHVVQNVEVIDGVPVFYSLGNYIFDQYFSTEVMEGLVLKLEVKPEPKVTLYPVSTAAGLSQPSLMEGNEKISFLHSLGQRSGDVASHIVQREIALPEWLAMRQKTAMITKQ